jgi:uncharacterized protein (DUF1499 family)
MKWRYSIMFALTVMMMACATQSTMDARTTRDRLAPCPPSPNCVSSLSVDKSHRVAPLRYEATVDEAREKLISVLSAMNRSEIVTADGDYIHSTFKSFLFRFVDDVEFAFDDQRKVIDIRSASRTGYTDLGVNRRRVEEIRRRFMAP